MVDWMIRKWNVECYESDVIGCALLLLIVVDDVNNECNAMLCKK